MRSTDIALSASLTFVSTPEDKLAIVLPLIYPDDWLDSLAIEFKREDVTYRQFLSPVMIQRYQITPPQTLGGQLSQLWAATFHNIKPKRLAAISKAIPKVYICTGDTDHLVKPINSYMLKSCMAEAEFEVWEKTGLVLIAPPLITMLTSFPSRSWPAWPVSESLCNYHGAYLQ